ncbi:MAG: Mut7-C RNAse domain-containing protein, partial [Natrialbaceae archaeon]
MASERLLLDVMLGKLTTYLRMCGYDAAYAHDVGLETDEAIRERAHSEGRTLLTRDRRLAAGTDDALLLESKEIEGQLAECAHAAIDQVHERD